MRDLRQYAEQYGIPIEYDKELDSRGLAYLTEEPRIVLRSRKLPDYVLAHELGHLIAKKEHPVKHWLNDSEGAVGNLFLRTWLGRKLISDAVRRKEGMANEAGLELLRELGRSRRYLKTADKDYKRYIDELN